MTTIEIVGEDLVIHVRGLHKLLAFRSELRIPLGHIDWVDRADDELAEWKGLRIPGTSVPGFWAGTFYASGTKAFWDVAGGARAIAIGLHDDEFDKLIVDVDDPDAAIRTILRAAATPR